jgi:hypothetical protein
MMDRPPTLASGELYYKLLAVRTQLALHETDAQLGIARAELARGHHAKLVEGLPALEAQALADLGAPNGARFNWTTFGYDDPPVERATTAAD